jgi:hypothetical protein
MPSLLADRAGVRLQRFDAGSRPTNDSAAWVGATSSPDQSNRSGLASGEPRYWAARECRTSSKIFLQDAQHAEDAQHAQNAQQRQNLIPARGCYQRRAG